MKKILLIVAILTTGFASCKKDEAVKPASASSIIIMGGDKKDLSGWD